VRPQRALVEGSNLTQLPADASANLDEGGNMHAMLRDLFGMHDVREDNYEPQLGVQCGEEQIMNDEPDKGDAQKYDDLLKKVNKPLHEKTRHSKHSATVHLYNLKCVSRVTNTIFLAFLEFFNQLLPDDG
jgi:hypothetical protein